MTPNELSALPAVLGLILIASLPLWMASGAWEWLAERLTGKKGGGGTEPSPPFL